MPYVIVRHYLHGGKRVIKRVPTLALAQAHCKNPETSSTTCKRPDAIRRTKSLGPWFDAYDEVK